jgi:uncharacterized protein YndB with AHSA1/START domain
VGWKLSAAIVLLMGGFLAAGWALPGTWEGEASRVIAAPVDSVFALLDSPRRWDEWTPWPEIPFQYEGPARGSGARRSWDAPDVGTGSFTITEAEPPTLIRYEVALAGESQPMRGSFRLEAASVGTRVTWREEGDFGANPVLGWTALAMRRRHGKALDLRLEGLAAAAQLPRAR